MKNRFKKENIFLATYQHALAIIIKIERSTIELEVFLNEQILLSMMYHRIMSLILKEIFVSNH
jgi:DNA-binding XRE family transcriptional regulator